jgi:hypothetical protein
VDAQSNKLVGCSFITQRSVVQAEAVDQSVCNGRGLDCFDDRENIRD